nr:emerin-like isoform X3 [Salvelinus alpinus]
MAALRNKSDQEIKDLLDEYGIKHGPVVDTTRPLYEKKLKEAMAKAKVTVTKPSPDRTFYREDKEEVTYVTCQTPVRSEGPSGDGKPYMRSRPEYSERDRVDDKPYSRPEYRRGTGWMINPIQDQNQSTERGTGWMINSIRDQDQSTAAEDSTLMSPMSTTHRRLHHPTPNQRPW